MKAKTPISVALGGALERFADGWRWSDGMPEPRVRDMLLADIAPNFRVVSGKVEIPARWREARYWPNGRIDTQAAEEIAALIADAGRRSPIYAEGLAERLDAPRLKVHGYVIDVAQWDEVMREPCGVWWDKQHEDEILERARR